MGDLRLPSAEIDKIACKAFHMRAAIDKNRLAGHGIGTGEPGNRIGHLRR